MSQIRARGSVELNPTTTTSITPTTTSISKLGNAISKKITTSIAIKKNNKIKKLSINKSSNNDNEYLSDSLSELSDTNINDSQSVNTPKTPVSPLSPIPTISSNKAARGSFEAFELSSNNNDNENNNNNINDDDNKYGYKYQMNIKKKFKSKIMNPEKRRSLKGVKLPLSNLEIQTEKLIVCVIECKNKELGFDIKCDEFNMNALVVCVKNKEHIENGVKIGYCIAKIGNKIVLDLGHNDILSIIDKSKFPAKIAFADRSVTYKATFNKTPLGFGLKKDENLRNALVTRVQTKAKKKGVCIGSWLEYVGDVYVWGMNYSNIIKTIRNAEMPVEIQFRTISKKY